MGNNADTILDLNAGYFGLGKIISLDISQQRHLLSISDLVYNYAMQKSKPRPLNIYIEASPGAGKSFFVNQVINSVKELLGDNKFVSKTYNLTCIQSTDELVGAFRLIQSINIEGMIPIVFFDEIDYPIKNEFYSYPFFLAPMFDGKIYESGNDYNIGAAILFFAASRKLHDILKKPNKDEQNEAHPKHSQYYPAWHKEQKSIFFDIIKNWDSLDKPEKLPIKIKDFLDRIDEVVFIPPANVLPKGNEKTIQQQAAFISASFLKKHFPGVKMTNNWTLALLAKQVYKYSSYRELDSAIFNSTPPIDGYFDLENLPYTFRTDNKDYIEQKIKQITKKTVQIVT